MAQIGFIGLGNMGLPMARNLIKAGHTVTGYDLSTAASDRFASDGGVAATALDMACMGADAIITMLPAGKDVRDVYLQRGGVLASAQQDALLIDASTIDVETARAVAAAAQVNELSMVDAPVSGGVAGAEAGTLTFMVGGSDRAFERAKPILEAMGKTIVHAGGPGSRAGGQDLQQHDSRRVDDRGLGSVRARREARHRSAKTVRHCIEGVGPVLGDDDVLPGAGPGADLARQPRLSGRLHGGDDA